eukprot:4284329-Prymnesium_polylepis.1
MQPLRPPASGAGYASGHHAWSTSGLPFGLATQCVDALTLALRGATWARRVRGGVWELGVWSLGEGWGQGPARPR